MTVIVSFGVVRTPAAHCSHRWQAPLIPWISYRLTLYGMTRWSYHVEAMNISERWSPKRQAHELHRLTERLNYLGSSGWELVAYEAMPLTGAFTNNIKGYAYLALFKQPVPEPTDGVPEQPEGEAAVPELPPEPEEPELQEAKAESVETAENPSEAWFRGRST